MRLFFTERLFFNITSQHSDEQTIKGFKQTNYTLLGRFLVFFVWIRDAHSHGRAQRRIEFQSHPILNELESVSGLNETFQSVLICVKHTAKTTTSFRKFIS